MSDLAEFLLARIAEDEADARANPLMDEDDYDEENVDGILERHSRQPHGNQCEWINGSLVRPEDECECGWPAQILAECEAKRRIVELHRFAEASDYNPPIPVCHECGPWEDTAFRVEYQDARGYPCTTLCLLALPYADHPDYRDEWRP